MRGLRTFLGLLIVLVALCAYLYFVESKRTPGDDGPKKEKVFNVEADKIEEIAIKSDTGEQTTLRKSGAEWQMVSRSRGSRSGSSPAARSRCCRSARRRRRAATSTRNARTTRRSF